MNAESGTANHRYFRVTLKEGVQHCKTTHRYQHMGGMNSCQGTNQWGPNIKRQWANRKEIIIEPHRQFSITRL